jgi:hypothetical protein
MLYAVSAIAEVLVVHVAATNMTNAINETTNNLRIIFLLLSFLKALSYFIFGNYAPPVIGRASIQEGQVVKGYPLETRINGKKRRPQRDERISLEPSYRHLLVTPFHDFLRKV